SIGLNWTLAEDGRRTVLRLSDMERMMSGGDARPAIVHPGSGGPQKCWPVERFAAVIHALRQRDLPVLVLAGPAERERIEELRRALSEPSCPGLLQWLIDAPLPDVARRLVNGRVYLGNDSGLTHLAALLCVPTVALFGPSDPRVWHP